MIWPLYTCPRPGVTDDRMAATMGFLFFGVNSSTFSSPWILVVESFFEISPLIFPKSRKKSRMK